MVERIPPQRFTARVMKRENVASTFFVTTFRVEGETRFRYHAGQHVMFHIANDIRRTLSISSAPDSGDTFEICHDTKPGGPASHWTRELTRGSTVQFTGPLGVFTLDPSDTRSKVFIATGSGISPIRSMIEYGLSAGVGGAYTLLWGLRYPEDVFWQDRFVSLARQYRNFRSTIVLSQPGEEWTGLTGRVTDHLSGTVETNPNALYYVVGNKQMVVDVQEYLSQHGIGAGFVFTEKFF